MKGIEQIDRYIQSVKDFNLAAAWIAVCDFFLIAYKALTKLGFTPISGPRE